ncbi:MAG: toll/interleukin-1 receptor domain-containing protein [Abitibacteriaceae bacterium]|nr:toll/interleukin-1 receptor domain-containing protein [Abditibacteriaceae bacterium]MBV9868978.1 toll/interleukin-1 receptor domain-containing protein [Abditibacteriaceae bacterium]
MKDFADEQLQVFLCHATEDKPIVRELYYKLVEDKVRPWFDEENLIPGQEWKVVIPKEVRKSHIVLVCLSKNSVNKFGYVQKEIKIALDIADEQPEGTIYIVPARLEPCDLPERLKHLHCVNLYEPGGYENLMKALNERAKY